jgi:hypothetical protein
MTEHPITPPPELVEQWADEFYSAPIAQGDALLDIATRAAQWGSNQELEACCLWLEKNVGRWEIPLELRDARRPKPPSLKEQALQALAEADLGSTEAEWSQRFDTIRRALEQLDD